MSKAKSLPWSGAPKKLFNLVGSAKIRLGWRGLLNLKLRMQKVLQHWALEVLHGNMHALATAANVLATAVNYDRKIVYYFGKSCKCLN